MKLRIPSRKFLSNLKNRRHFLPLLSPHLPIRCSSESGENWIQTADGLRFQGPRTNEEQKVVHKLFRLGKHFPLTHFGIIDELVDRYDVPRSFGGGIVLSSANPRQGKYRTYRDPFADFNPKHWEEFAQFAVPREGDFAVDVGAYHGIGTLRLLREVGESGFVLAVEGDPEYFRKLAWNLSENSKSSNYTLVESFASSHTGEVRTLLHNEDAMVRSLEASTLASLRLQGLSESRVETKSVDRMILDSGLGARELNYLSITVNGHELDVLKGMSRAIDRSSRMAVSAAGWYLKDGIRVAESLGTWLSNRGFEVRVGNRGRVIAWKG